MSNRQFDWNSASRIGSRHAETESTWCGSTVCHERRSERSGVLRVGATEERAEPRDEATWCGSTMSDERRLERSGAKCLTGLIRIRG